MKVEIRPTLYIQIDVWQKLIAFVQACPQEINGLGYLKPHGKNGVLLTEVFILPQVVTPVSVDCSAEAVASHLTQMIKNGEDPAKLRFQWHSHVDGEVYYSGVDTHTIDHSYIAAPWIISMVLNKRAEYVCRIDWFEDFRLSLSMEVKIVTTRDQATEDFAQQEVAEKVKFATTGWFGRSKTKAITPEQHDSSGIILEGGVHDDWHV
jgi:hypothetical protein